MITLLHSIDIKQMNTQDLEHQKNFAAENEEQKRAME